MSNAERIARLERRVRDMEIALRGVPNLARPHPGGQVRIAKCGATGEAYPATGSSFPITFIHLDSADAEVVRSAEHPQCWNVAGTIPTENTVIVAYEFRGRWYTQYCCEKGELDYSQCVGVLTSSLQDDFTDESVFRPDLNAFSEVSGGMLKAGLVGSSNVAEIAHCLDLSGWPVDGFVEHSIGIAGSTVSAVTSTIGVAAGAITTFNYNISSNQIVIADRVTTFLNTTGNPSPTEVRLRITKDEPSGTDTVTVEAWLNGSSLGTWESQIGDAIGDVNARVDESVSWSPPAEGPPATTRGLTSFNIIRSW